MGSGCGGLTMSKAPHVEVAVQHRIGSLTIDAAFNVMAPWTVLFGPSGSGKSTLLRMMAGLVRPDVGRISLFGEPVCGQAIWVPAHRRKARWAGQRAALFPRKTVKWNVVMGMGDAYPGRSWMDAMDYAMQVFGLRAIEDAYPDDLSGGQRQLVSVVRAAVGARHKLLLLDEPFAGLDAGVREALIAALREWVGDTAPIVSVTHDVSEAFLLGAEVVRIGEGRVLAQGPAGKVLVRERERILQVLGGAAEEVGRSLPQTKPHPFA